MRARLTAKWVPAGDCARALPPRLPGCARGVRLLDAAAMEEMDYGRAPLASAQIPHRTRTNQQVRKLQPAKPRDADKSRALRSSITGTSTVCSLAIMPSPAGRRTLSSAEHWWRPRNLPGRAARRDWPGPVASHGKILIAFVPARPAELLPSLPLNRFRRMNLSTSP